jgi:hypothetical protein
MILNWTFWKKILLILLILLIVLVISSAWDVVQPSSAKSSLGFSSSSSSNHTQEFFSQRNDCTDDPTINSSRGVPMCSSLRQAIITNPEHRKKVPLTGSLKDGTDVLDSQAIVIVNSHSRVPQQYQKECLYHQNCKNLINPNTRRLYCPPGIQPIRNATSSIVEGCIGGTSGDDSITTINVENGSIINRSGIHCRLSPDTSTKTPCRNLSSWAYLPKGLTIVNLHEIFKMYAQQNSMTPENLKSLLKQNLLSLLILPIIRNHPDIPIQSSSNRKLLNFIQNPHNTTSVNEAEQEHFPQLSSFIDRIYQQFIGIYKSQLNPLSSSRYCVLYYFPNQSQSGEIHYAFSFDSTQIGDLQISYKSQNGLTMNIPVMIRKDSQFVTGGHFQIDPSSFPKFVYSG